MLIVFGVAGFFIADHGGWEISIAETVSYAAVVIAGAILAK